jgi:hypothetical protein
MLNTGGTSGSSGASLLLYSDTTIGVRSQASGAGAGTFYVADIAQGVVLARTPQSSSAGLRITNETADAVAQVNPGGGMAVASDVGTGTIAVSCEDRQSKVFFPYVDDRVPCENNVVRTLSNNRTIDDSHADSNSPLTAAVAAAGTNVAADKQGENAAQPQGAVNRSNSKETSEEKEKESSSAAIVVASPTPDLPRPCGGGGQIFTDPGSPFSEVFEMGATSGTFIFSFDGGGSLADTFDVTYEGRSLSGFPFTTNSFGSLPVTYSGRSTQITVRITPNTAPGNLIFFAVGCPTSSGAAHSGASPTDGGHVITESPAP